MNFVYDVEKDDFLKSWRSLSIHSDGFLAARTSRTNERQETCPELTSFGLFTERTKKLPELTSFRVFTERTKKLAEPTSFRVFTERKRKLAEPTSFRVFTERKRKLAEPTRLRILNERTKQWLWLLLIENSRNDVFQPLSRTSKNGSNQKYSQEEYTNST